MVKKHFEIFLIKKNIVFKNFCSGICEFIFKKSHFKIRYTSQEQITYLGLLNYGKIIPNMSVEIRELYYLLRKCVKFDWIQAKCL